MLLSTTAMAPHFSTLRGFFVMVGKSITTRVRRENLVLEGRATNPFHLGVPLLTDERTR